MRRLSTVALILALGAGLARADVSAPSPRRRAGTFCEFSVFHAETGEPMAGVRYRVTLPSGRVRSGRVPSSGIVHVDVPRAGDCTIELDLPRGYLIADGK